MKYLAALLLLCGQARALSVETQGGSVSTATLTLNGQSNLALPYGVTFTTAAGTYVQASSITATGGITSYGSFSVGGGSLTVSNGNVSAGGQPFVKATLGTNKFTQAVDSQAFFDAPTESNNTGNMFGGTSSSGTFTVPAGGGGKYYHYIQTYAGNVNGYWNFILKKNGTSFALCLNITSTTAESTPSCFRSEILAAGDVITVFVSQNGAVDAASLSNGSYSWFEMGKDLR